MHPEKPVGIAPTQSKKAVNYSWEITLLKESTVFPFLTTGNKYYMGTS
jgi:hypothetical protein